MLAAVVACVLSAGLPVAGAPAHTKRQIAEDQTLIVRLAYGKLVFIQLPEPIHSVDTILPATRLMVGENSPYLSLGLVDQTLTDGRVGVYGVSGKLYILFFEQVQDKADVEIAITRTTATTKAVQGFTPSSFVRALRPSPNGQLRMTIPGAQPTAPLLPGLLDTRIAFHDALQLTANGLQGLRVTVKNLESTPLKLDVRVGDPLSVTTDPAIVAFAQWAWPPKYDVDLLAVETNILPAQGETYLYVIYKERR